jgi:hypothetical protein
MDYTLVEPNRMRKVMRHKLKFKKVWTALTFFKFTTQDLLFLKTIQGAIVLKRSCLLYCTQEPTKSKATKNRFISNWFKQLDIQYIEMGFFKQWI